MRWSEGFRATGEGPAVFLVAPAQRAAVLAWVARQCVPTLSRRDLHVPAVDAWAVLDGGLLRLHTHPGATLPAGLRVIGFAALRLLAADLGLPGPRDPLPGEDSRFDDPDDLRRDHLATGPADPAAVEQVELLASCTDAPMLRWVTTALRTAHVST